MIADFEGRLTDAVKASCVISAPRANWADLRALILDYMRIAAEILTESGIPSRAAEWSYPNPGAVREARLTVPRESLTVSASHGKVSWTICDDFSSRAVFLDDLAQLPSVTAMEDRLVIFAAGARP